MAYHAHIVQCAYFLCFQILNNVHLCPETKGKRTTFKGNKNMSRNIVEKVLLKYDWIYVLCTIIKG